MEEISTRISVAFAVYTAAVAAVLCVLVTLVRYGRSLFFHALSSFPGPVYAACSDIPYAYWNLRGSVTWRLLSLHATYGPVVRVGPNTLSFRTLSAAHTVYDAHESFRKSSFYDGFAPGTTNPVRSVVALRNPGVHRTCRGHFDCCFGESAVDGQEKAVKGRVRDFVGLVRKKGCDGKAKAEEKGVGEEVKAVELEVGVLLDCLAFDVMGMVAMRKDFGCLRDGELHFWARAVRVWYFLVAFLDAKRRFPLLLGPVEWVLGLMAGDKKVKTRDYALQAFNDRINPEKPAAANNTNVDYIGIVKTQPPHTQPHHDILLTNSTGFVGAGSETVSVVMSGLLFFLATNRGGYERLAGEVRGVFSCLDEVAAKVTSQLPYLNAVIMETLRMYPAVPVGGSRVSPGAEVDGWWVPAEMEVVVHHWAIHHDAANFKDPLRFVPERWLDTEARPGLEGCMLPFLLGPRDCPGKNLALMELQLFAACVLVEFDFALRDPGLDFVRESRSFSVWKRPELWVRFLPRRRSTPKL